MAQGRFTPPAAGYKPLSLISAISVWAARPPPATPSPLRPLAPPIPMPAIESRATEAALPPAPTGTAAAAPRIWLLLDDRPGHITQVVGLAEADRKSTRLNSSH